MMIKGVIFDMDGLMFDTERMWCSFWEPALAAQGLPFYPQMAADTRGSAGKKLREIICSYYAPGFDPEPLLDRLYEIADREFAKPVPKKKGLDELLAWLSAQNIPMAVASSSPEHLIRNHLKNCGVEHFFKAVVPGNLIEHSKPSPDIFLCAAEKLGLAPADCLVLEDSYNGIRAGRAGGFVTVMVPDLSPDNAEMQSLYDARFDDLLQVRDALADDTLALRK